MKHIFVVNPAAGQGKAADLIPKIRRACEEAGASYIIHRTVARGEGETFVRRMCEENRAAGETRATGETRERADDTGTTVERRPKNPEPLRFYACGGDGTLNEVVNGAAGFEFAAVGNIPAGTGNDFIRNFPGGDYTNIAAQIRGMAVPCDLIRYRGLCDGIETDRYCVNMFNIGFDCNVVDMTARMKQIPLVTGSFAYLWSIAAMLLEKKGADLRVEYPDGYVYDGKLLLIAVANGCFCGGGIKGIPHAKADDALIDISLVRNVSRRTFVQLFPKYMKGTHLQDPRLEDVIRYTKEESLVISPNGDEMRLCVDGEIASAASVRFDICPAAFRFIVPAE